VTDIEHKKQLDEQYGVLLAGVTQQKTNEALENAGNKIAIKF